MTISMSSAALPMIRQYIASLSSLLDKAEAHADSHAIKHPALLTARLYPDMLPLTSQVQLACDFAKGTAARLSGTTNPGFADTEQTFAELRDRIARTLEFIGTVAPAAIDGSEDRPVAIKFGKFEFAFRGEDYLIGFALPNVIFHVSTAYAILRHNGVPIGKLDFLGALKTAQ